MYINSHYILLLRPKYCSYLPVSDQKLKLLEWNLSRVFQSQSSILCEVMEMLQVVFLDVIEQVVDQDRAGHQRQGKDGGAVTDCGVLVK